MSSVGELVYELVAGVPQQEEAPEEPREAKAEHVGATFDLVGLGEVDCLLR